MKTMAYPILGTAAYSLAFGWSVYTVFGMYTAESVSVAVAILLLGLMKIGLAFWQVKQSVDLMINPPTRWRLGFREWLQNVEKFLRWLRFKK